MWVRFIVILMFDVRMPGQFLGLGQARPVPEKLRNVGVPPGRVEVGDAFRGL